MTEFHLSGMKKNIVLKTSAQASAQFLRRITSVLNRKLNEPILDFCSSYQNIQPG